MTFVHIFFRGVVHVLRIVFVEGIVGQMNITTIEIVAGRFVVLLGSKSCETFVIDIESKWICSSHEDIDPKIEFELIDKKWIFDILLDNILIAVEDIFDISS